MNPLLDVCVRKPIMDPVLDVCVRKPIMDPVGNAAEHSTAIVAAYKNKVRSLMFV